MTLSFINENNFKKKLWRVENFAEDKRRCLNFIFFGENESQKNKHDVLKTYKQAGVWVEWNQRKMKINLFMPGSSAQWENSKLNDKEIHTWDDGLFTANLIQVTVW